MTVVIVHLSRLSSSSIFASLTPLLRRLEYVTAMTDRLTVVWMIGAAE
ncbi:hypothetical protein [Xanthomonas sp. MUS 060]|nr:hypothetical protein [Xanthomonas sp. MUS 060]